MVPLRWYQGHVGIGILAVSLALSAVALSVSVFCALRGAPARLETDAREALSIAHTVRMQLESVQAEVTSTLGAIQEERERAVRAQRRASADRVRVEGSGATGDGPVSREEAMVRLRQQAGLI